MDLERRGVQVRWLEPASLGEITPELVRDALTSKTRLVALASCHFLSGYRPDLEAIGDLLHARGILFSVDAIQTLGAFPLDVERCHVDLLSADAHKWMLGPMAIGIVYVRQSRFETVRPTLLGAWNVESPRFLAQEFVEFVPTARRYEPGVLNAVGIYGMKAALELLLAVKIERIATRILSLKKVLLSFLEPLGFRVLGPTGGTHASGITTVWHPETTAEKLSAALEAADITASLRHDRSGRGYLRFSPHYYNTEEEMECVARALSPVCRSRHVGGFSNP
jgi:selenocysteine lyase/cysteine desulfurase